MIEQNLTRRSFLGLGAASLAITGSALYGCAPQATSSTSTAKSGTSDAEQGGAWSWLTQPEDIADANETRNHDIVIVGGGLAGTVAAWAAAKDGADVALVEKTGQLNGRSLMMGCINASIQSQRGVAFDEEEIVEELRRFMGGYTNTDLLRMYVRHSGKVFDELATVSEAHGGEPFYWGGGTPYSVDTPSYKEYQTPMGAAATVQELLGYLQEETEATGCFTLYTNSDAVRLTKENDLVTGIIVETNDGHVQINAASGVVMATGDYSANSEMVEAWAPMINRFASYETSLYTPQGANNGDGLKLMMWAGAAMQPISEHAPMIGSGGAVGSVNPFMRVNVYGERYENEAIPVSQALSGSMMQPQGLAWTIFDANCASAAEKQTIFNMGKSADNFTADALSKAVDEGTLLKADTLDALADAMEIDADAFAKTVARYNGFCETGVDEDYRKSSDNLSPIATAPFYAAPIVRQLECMMGGISIDKHLCVLDESGSPIPGLYAIGNCSGSYFAVDYPAIITGQSHGRAATQGYLVGKALAAGQDGVTA